MQPSHMLVYVHICLSDHNRPSKEKTLFFFLDFFLSSLMFPGVFLFLIFLLKRTFFLCLASNVYQLSTLKFMVLEPLKRADDDGDEKSELRCQGLPCITQKLENLER